MKRMQEIEGEKSALEKRRKELDINFNFFGYLLEYSVFSSWGIFHYCSVLIFFIQLN